MIKYNVSSYGNTRLFPAVLLILMLSFMFVLTACGDQNTPVPSQGVVVSPTKGASQTTAKATTKPGVTAPAAVHICTLLSKDEVAASLGGAVTGVDASRDALGAFGQGNCDYTTSSGGLTLQVSIAGGDGLSQADFEKSFITNNAQTVPDLGDAAFYQGGMLSTLKGKIVVVVLLFKPTTNGSSDNLTSATEVTQKVITALEKTSLASNLTSTVAASTTTPQATTTLPIYPGSAQISDDTISGTRIGRFISTDSYDKVVSWYKKIAADKSWTASVTQEPEAGYMIISVGKATATSSTRLLVSIEGPKKADRTAGSDANGNPVVLSSNSTLILVTLSGNL